MVLPCGVLCQLLQHHLELFGAFPDPLVRLRCCKVTLAHSLFVQLLLFGLRPVHQRLSRT